MGSPKTEAVRARYGEEQREVSFTHDLLISQFETTQAEWEASGLPNPSRTDRPDRSFPLALGWHWDGTGMALAWHWPRA